ncbi:MAG: substrate-binding domain-containing protein [Chitinispirillales bacterium]|nr:substrate-binding domain-containing protein [Chitinispirillales bacterium]
MEKILYFVFAAGVSLFFNVSCGGNVNNEITVISREESSGTRGAFDELIKISDGKINMLFREAIIVSSTDEAAFKTEVDKRAIAYTSIGSVTGKIKTLAVDGVEANEENVKRGAYKIFRPFVAGVPGSGSSPLARDFISYLVSRQGQKIVVTAGYIAPNDEASVYSASGLAGKLTLSGSTSVEKIMERLKEEYVKFNPDVKVEINYTGSTAGIKDCLSGKSNIVMSSRAFKADEKEKLEGYAFALDAIAVIVNKNNPIDEISSEMVTKIFKGEIRSWSDVK